MCIRKQYKLGGNQSMYANVKANRKKNRVRNNLIKVLLLFLFMLTMFFIINTIISRKNSMSLKNLDINLYISCADDASKGKLQVNWKYLAAINGVRYKGDFSKTNVEDLRKLADLFVIDNDNKAEGNKYKLRTFEEVLNILTFNEDSKKKANNYLVKLKNVGLIRSNLDDNSQNKKFIEELKPEAINIYKKYGIFPSITIAQAILESGWGKSDLTVNANNLFGIKADSSWKGKKVSMKTSEYYDKTINDYFRVYDNKIQSITDYGDFIYKNKRYKENGVFASTYYIEQAKAIEKAGYSTKENKKGEKMYAELLINIIRENNLQIIDHEAQIKN